MGFKKIRPQEIEGNVFEMVNGQWMLVTAGDCSGFNMLTANWGALGVLWGLPVATSYIRPQRYTYEFMEKSTYYTLSFYGEDMREMLNLCGTKSGRDIDKAKEAGLTPAFASCGAPYFAEAELVIVCKKLYYNDIDPKNFLDSRIAGNYYPDDYHRMYIGEVVEVLKKD